jgi:hypothetical protein
MPFAMRSAVQSLSPPEEWFPGNGDRERRLNQFAKPLILNPMKRRQAAGLAWLFRPWLAICRASAGERNRRRCRCGSRAGNRLSPRGRSESRTSSCLAAQAERRAVQSRRPACRDRWSECSAGNARRRVRKPRRACGWQGERRSWVLDGLHFGRPLRKPLASPRQEQRYLAWRQPTISS